MQQLCQSVNQPIRGVDSLPTSSFSSRNGMSDFGGEVMAEVLAERALVRPQIIPLVPLTNQYRHQEHMDLKDYKSKVSGFARPNPSSLNLMPRSLR